MSNLVRLSFSIERDLHQRLEKLVASSGYTNRSEFIRDLVRDRLVDRQWQSDEETIGTITIIYDHHKSNVAAKLTKLQHSIHNSVLASTHVHLDEKLCAEVIIVRARAKRIRKLTDTLRRQKGILHAVLTTSSTGEDLG